MLAMSKLDNCYAHWKSETKTHEFWMYGTLARFDWSQFKFEFPATEQ
jgi:hypothetical protein